MFEQHRPDRSHEPNPRRRTGPVRGLATALGVLVLAGLMIVLAPASAQASGCTVPPCGAIKNTSTVSIRYKWTDNDRDWFYAYVAPGQTAGGFWNDRRDVDFFEVPYGCVAIGSIPNGNHLLPYYGPSGWNKIGSAETLVISRISCRDGYVYAWASAANLWGSAAEGQMACRFYNDDGNWGDNCGNYRNIASTVQNNSSSGNVIKFFYHTNYTGAYACLGSGDAWRNLAAGIYFSFSPGLSGYGVGANDEIAGSRWARTCS